MFHINPLLIFFFGWNLGNFFRLFLADIFFATQFAQPTKKMSSWAVREVNFVTDSHSSTCLGEADLPTFSIPKANVTDSVVMLFGSSCSFADVAGKSSWDLYRDDALKRINWAKKMNAVGVIFVESQEKPLTLIDFSNLPLPTVSISKSSYEGLSSYVASHGNVVNVDFSSVTLYQPSEERFIATDQPLTAIQVKYVDDPAPVDIPAYLADFNPAPTANISNATVAVVQWDSVCWATSYAECIPCWNLASPIKNGESLRGKAALVRRTNNHDMNFC
jgi:hypothetical protein